MASFYNPYFAQNSLGAPPIANSGNIQASGGKYSYVMQDPHDPGNSYQFSFDPSTGKATRTNMGNGRGWGTGTAQVDPTQYFGADFVKQYSSQPPTDIGTRNVAGIGNVDIQQDPRTGTTFYSQGGKNYALNAQQMGDAGIPSVAGYDSQGNPYYAQPQTTAQKAAEDTPEAAALKQLGKTDPATLANVNKLQTYYGGQANAINKGLDPVTTNQIQQDSRAAQIARGNALGPAQAVQEALTTGQAGINLRSQEAQGLQGYLNSGTTPAAMGSRQLSDILNQYQSSNTQTPFQSTYNPQNTYTYYNPNSPQQFAQGANNWYNSANQQYLGAGYLGGQGGGNSALSSGIQAGTGALTGALSGAAMGSAVPGVGTLLGAIGGGLAGGLGGYGAGGGFR